MTDNCNQDFDNLARLWQQEDTPSLAALKQQIGRAAMRNRIAFLAELAIGTGGAGFGLWIAYGGQWLVGAATFLFASFGLFVSLATRLRSAQHDMRSVHSALSAAIEQSRKQFRTAIGGILVCGAALLFVAVLTWDASVSAEITRSALQRSVRTLAVVAMVMGLAVGLMAAMLWRCHARMLKLQRARGRLHER